ncbi:M23 family metallopeptidase [Streptomyces sp. NPDC006368]|uniref:murein hydrolase activator EnvC family protein n=1 Tax=Streptomyces sp. NPDC006368 TaxID=3156760 RepID=UPI0033A423FA
MRTLMLTLLLAALGTLSGPVASGTASTNPAASRAPGASRDLAASGTPVAIGAFEAPLGTATSGASRATWASRASGATGATGGTAASGYFRATTAFGATGASRASEAYLPDVAATWPVGPPRPTVVRGWEPPASPYGPGHRGVDLGAAPGAPVRAAASGTVSFAGPVAGRGVLTIAHATPGTPLRTSYEPVQPLVRTGARVTAGQVVARLTTARPHCAPTCLHWSLRHGDTYLNPLSLLPPHLLHRPPSRLLPLPPG